MFPEESPLRRARKAAGKTVTEVAEAMGVDQSTLSRLEIGVLKASARQAEWLARYFGTVSEIEILYPERFCSAVLADNGRAA